MNTRFKNYLIAVAAASQLGIISLPVQAADAAVAPANNQEKLLPELISGAYGVLNVISAVTDWFSNRPNSQALSSLLTQPQSNTVGITTPFQLPATSATPAFSPSYAATPIIIGQPDIPLNVGTGSYSANQPWNQTANYQGVQVSVVVLNQSNQAVETRSLNSTFKTGDRFKLQLISTFDGYTSVDAYKTTNLNGISNQSWSGQLYPAKSDQVIKIRAGETVLLPIGANEYFTFDNQTGLDRLMLNVRHLQAKGTQASAQPVYRQDSGLNSTFMQLTPQGNYPALSQVLGFQHNP